jgi:hypothetical protein
MDDKDDPAKAIRLPGESNADAAKRMRDAKGKPASVTVDEKTGKAKPLAEYDPTKVKAATAKPKVEEPPKQDPGEGVLAYKKRMDAWNAKQKAKADGQKAAMAEK